MDNTRHVYELAHLVAEDQPRDAIEERAREMASDIPELADVLVARAYDQAAQVFDVAA